MIRIGILSLTTLSLIAWFLVSGLVVSPHLETLRWNIMQALLAVFGFGVVTTCVTLRRCRCTMSTLGLFISIACCATGFVFGGRYGYLYYPEHQLSYIGDRYFHWPIPTWMLDNPGSYDSL